MLGAGFRGGRRVLGRAVAVAIGLLLASVPLVSAAGISPTTGIGRGAHSSGSLHFVSDETSLIQLTVAPESTAALQAGAELTLSVTMINGSPSTISGVVSEAAFTAEPLGSRAELTQWLSGSAETPLSKTQALNQAPETLNVPAAATRSVRASVPAAELGLDESGVYGVLVTARAEGEVLGEARTVVVWQAQDAAAARFSLLAALSVPADAVGLLDAVTLQTYTGPAGLLTRQLDALEGEPVAIGIDPRIPASIRVLGTAAPASAIEWLRRLEALPNETFALAWADGDLTIGLQSGLTSPLVPTSLDFAIDPERFPEEPTITADPAPTPTPTASGSAALPSTDELLAGSYSIDSLAWPAAGTVTADDLAALAASGYTAAVLSSDNVAFPNEEAGASGVGGSRATIDGLPVAVADAQLTALLRDAIAAPSTARWRSSVTVLSAALYIDGANGVSSLATLPRTWFTAGSRISETLDAVSNLAWAQNDSVRGVVGGPGIAAQLVEREQDQTRRETVIKLLEAEQLESTFATIAADPERVTAPRRLALMSLLSVGWLEDQTTWSNATAGFLEESRALRSAVQVAESSTINLLSDRGSLPVTVRNGLDQPVTVFIRVISQSALLNVQDRVVELTIEPNSQNRGQVAVRSLGNGQVGLRVLLFGPDEQRIGESTEVSINVQAGWETAGTIAFGLIVVLVFAGGVVRTITKRRKHPVEGASERD